MVEWGAGYVTEVEYEPFYHSQLAPLRAAFALAYQGIDAALPAAPTYLELGFGQGLSLAVHAAANPGEFWGTDFNPAQVANARELAASSAIDVKLLEDSFAEFAARKDLPQFDMIWLHGIWSWITPENRGHIVEILRRHLKPGGVTFLSYNCAPGWAPTQPLQHILALHAARAGAAAAGVVANLDNAIAFTEKLVESGSLYFKANPLVAERLNQMKQGSRRYLVHEFLNDNWTIMPFSQTARELHAAKLSFGASASLFDHVPTLNVTAEGQALINETHDVVLRETIRDYLVNQQFRRDYFIKGCRRLKATQRLDRLRQFNVVLSTHPEDISLKVKAMIGEVCLEESIYRPLIDALAQTMGTPATIASLEARVGKSGVSLDKLLEAIFVLLGKRDVELAHDEATAEKMMPRTRALNQVVIDTSPFRKGINVLASPLTGTGIDVGQFGRQFIKSWQGGTSDAAACAKEAWAVLAAKGFVMRKGANGNTETEVLRAMEAARTFFDRKLPVLQSLRIV
jgi:SAM-dependent methyltransferase